MPGLIAALRPVAEFEKPPTGAESSSDWSSLLKSRQSMPLSAALLDPEAIRRHSLDLSSTLTWMLCICLEAVIGVVSQTKMWAALAAFPDLFCDTA